MEQMTPQKKLKEIKESFVQKITTGRSGELHADFYFLITRVEQLERGLLDAEGDLLAANKSSYARHASRVLETMP